MLHITFQYAPENLQEAYSLHYKKNSPLKGRLLLFLGVLLIWTGLLLILISRNEGRQLLNYSFVVYGIVAVAFHYWTINSLGKRMYKKLKDFREAIDITISEEGINMKVEKGESKIVWENIQMAIMSDTMVLLYPAKSSFYIFPKNDFQNGEFDSFVELVKRKIQKVK